MTSINALLEKRLGKKDSREKMKALAKKSQEGHLSSFSGVFSVTELSQEEKERLETILLEYGQQESVGADLEVLVRLTKEVKAINNQAALLHGERIKKVHALLTKYKEGAFTAWLLEAYGNRQTPYNFWQYYEFHSRLPETLHGKLDQMPRQAIYTLATRDVEHKEKEKIVEAYQGEGKKEMLEMIRTRFPLRQGDKRAKKPLERVFRLLEELKKEMSHLSKDDILAMQQRMKELL